MANIAPAGPSIGGSIAGRFHGQRIGPLLLIPTLNFSQGGSMDDKENLTIKIEYPAPKLTPEEEEFLKKKLESAVVLFFPELRRRGEIMVIVGPKADHR